MKNKKILKKIAYILSIILLIINICIYIKMKYTWSEIGSNHNQYENASLIISGLFKYGILIYGILLIPIVWLAYFLTILLIKINSRFNSLKKLLLCSIILIILVTISILFTKMILLILTVVLA